ncbi:MAG: hypothetical protein J6J60_06560 [Clostridia bacterium]|nr:hypothetical protein [Clostridia bacterium]
MKLISVLFEPETQVSAKLQAQITNMFQACHIDNSMELYELKNYVFTEFGFNSNIISFSKDIIVNIS